MVARQFAATAWIRPPRPGAMVESAGIRGSATRPGCVFERFRDDAVAGERDDHQCELQVQGSGQSSGRCRC